MCATCGCDQTDGGVVITTLGTTFKKISNGELLMSEHHTHHTTEPNTSGSQQRHIIVEEDILSKNNSQAQHNRHHFEQDGVFAINLVSSPGSGKTTLLERTLVHFKESFSCYVIEGDQQTTNDAERIATTGVAVAQINTGKGCHLDADMVHRALHRLSPSKNSLVFIENVGNLVCPALFDLGENARVVIISVTEGDDKPLKYPHMFASSQLCLINKVDLLPYVDFDIQKTKEYALRANPNINFIEISATKETGMTQWYEWLIQQAKSIKSTPEKAIHAH